MRVMDIASEMPIRSLLTRIRRRWTDFALLFGAAVGLAVVTYVTVTPHYTATASILVQRNTVTPIAGTGPGAAPVALPQDTVGDAADIESQMEIIRSPRLIRMTFGRPEVREALTRACTYERRQPFGRLRAAARRLFGAYRPCDFAPSSETIERVQDELGVSASGRSRVIDVAYTSALPEASATFVNALVGIYLADNAAEKSKARLQTAKWLEAEVGRLRGDLSAKETQITQYERSHDLLQGQISLTTRERLTSLITQLGDAQAKLAAATSRLAELRAAQKSGSYASIPEVVASVTIGKLRTQEADIDTRLGELSSLYGPLYPQVQEAQAQKVKINAAIDAEVNRIAESLQREVSDAASSVENLQAYFEKAKREASAANSADSELQSLVRDAEVDRTLYADLSMHTKALETETRAESPDARLVSLAELPDKPSFPRPLSFVLASFCVAGTLASVGAFVRDLADQTVRVASDIVAQIAARNPIQVLGRVPFVRNLEQDFHAVISHDLSPLREAMRALYARIRLGGSPAKVLAVTSSAPREGKSSLAIGLAQYASSLNQRVLLVEADLRKPVFRLLLPLSRSADGLIQVLRGEIEPEHAVESLGKLDVMHAGAVAVDSTELLASSRMRSLLETARQHYDLVVIDTPPCQYLMDACIVGHQSDGVLYAARWGYSRPEAVRAGVESLDGVNILGVVLNMVDTRRYGAYDASTPAPVLAYLEDGRALKN